MESNIVITQKVKLELPYDPVIPQLGIYEKEVKYSKKTLVPPYLFQH
jgi:hypothetical protein